LADDGTATFAKLGLDRHLSPTRRNGLHSMVSRIKALAAASIAQPA
jgi:cysteine desulfuration protein SufE